MHAVSEICCNKSPDKNGDFEVITKLILNRASYMLDGFHDHVKRKSFKISLTKGTFWEYQSFSSFTTVLWNYLLEISSNPQISPLIITLSNSFNYIPTTDKVTQQYAITYSLLINTRLGKYVFLSGSSD